MKEKILMYRWQGEIEWEEYKDDGKPVDLKEYETGEIYTCEYKVIERKIK